jgi:hypothetical protein
MLTASASRRAPRAAVAAAIALAIAIASAAFLLTASSHDAPSAPRAAAAPARADLAATFLALRRPPATSVPPAVATYATQLGIGDRYRLDARQARAITPPGAARSWYLLSSDRGLCLWTPDASVCQDAPGARAGRLYLVRLPRSRSTRLPSRAHPVVTTVIGVAPDGVRMVVGHTFDGRSITTTPNDNTYILRGRGLASLTLLRAAGAPLTVDSLPPYGGA